MLFARVAAEPLLVQKGDSIASVLKANIGARVTLKLKSGDELIGKIKVVNW